MLRDRHNHAGDIDLLEAVLTEHGNTDICGDGNEGYGIHVSRRQRRYEIGRAGSGCGTAHADLSRGSRIAACGVTGVLLLTHKNVPYAAVNYKRVVKRGNRCPRISEYNRNALLL